MQKTAGRRPATTSRAMDDPKSAIWRRAQAEVERQRAGQTTLAATVPFRTRALTDVEQTVAAARKRERYPPTLDLAGHDARTRDAPRARRLRPPLRRRRRSGGWAATPRRIGWPAVRRVQAPDEALWQGMDPRRRAAARSAYLKDKPYLRPHSQ